MSDFGDQYPYIKGVPRPPPLDPNLDENFMPNAPALPPAIVPAPNPVMTVAQAMQADQSTARFLPKSTRAMVAQAPPADEWDQFPDAQPNPPPAANGHRESPYGGIEPAGNPGSPGQPAAVSPYGPPAPAAAAPVADDWSQFPDAKPAAPESTALGSFGRQAALNAVPSAGGIAAFGPGAMAGGAAIAPIAALTGPLAPYVEGAGALGGGVAASMGASSLIGRSQRAVMKFLPAWLKQKMGVSDEQLAADAAQHPIASEAGAFAPNVVAFRPGFSPGAVTTGQKVLSTAANAGMGGAISAGEQYADKGEIDPEQVAKAAVLQAVMQKPTAIGRKLLVESPAQPRVQPAAPPAQPQAPPLVQLAPKDKMTQMPMTDAEIKIAQAQMNRGTPNKAQPPDVVFGQPAPEGAKTRDDLAADRKAKENNLLPAPGRATMSQDEIARAQAAMRGGNQSQTETPGQVFGSEARAPQTRDNLASQDEAAGAFALAERQRERLQGKPDTLDTQAAGRPEGVNAQPVHLDEGFPVQILERKLVPDAKGNMVEVALAQRYDPRTGQPEADSVPYLVPVKSLKVKNYAKEPRQATEFVERAAGPPPPEQPRMPNEPVSREDKQTFRATAPDNNENFPGASPLGRSPFPEQPAGPSRYKTESDAEAWFKAEQERRARGEQTQGERDSEAKAQQTYSKTKSSADPQPKAADGWPTDEFGYVKSKKGGPIIFADQKQAGKWIIKKGQVDTDQIFEVANHPGGKGFTVRMRGRSKPQTEAPADQGTNKAGATEAPKGPQKLLPGQGEKPADNVSHETISEKAKPQAKPQRSLEEQQKIVRDLQAEVRKRGKPFTKNKKRELAAIKSQLDAENTVLKGMLDQAGIKRGVEGNLKRVPLTLAGFIRKNGGLKDPDGELAAMDIKNNRRLRGILNEKSGLDPDHMREKLVEAGFLPGFENDPNRPSESTTRDLYDAIAQEAAGKPQYNLRKPPDPRDLAKPFDATENEAQADQYRAELESHARAEKIPLSEDEILTILRDYRDKDPVDGLTDYLEDRAREHAAGFEPSQPDETGIPFPEGETANGADEQRGTQGTDEPAAGAPRQPGDEPGRAPGAGPEHPGSSGGGAASEAKAQDQRLIDTPEESARDIAARNADKRIKGEGNQKSVDDLGLFNEGRAGESGDMFTPPKKPPGKFYSNPFFNPYLMGDLLSSAGRKTMQLLNSEIRNWTREAKRTERLLKDARDVHGFRNGLKQWALMNSEVLRGLGKKYPDVKAFMQAHDALSTQPGSGRAIKEVFEDAHVRQTNHYSNRMARILGDHADDEKFMESVRDILTTGRAGGAKETAVARNVANLLKEIRTYAVKAGVQMGDVKNYFPRLLDTDKVVANEDGFRDAAKKQYMEDGLNEKAAEQAAHELFLDHAVPDNLFLTPATRGKDSTKGRSWGPGADKNMREFLVKDPGLVLFNYIDGMTYRAEWSRRFGQDNEKIQEWIKSMSGKVSPEDVSLFKDAILASTGRMRSHTGSFGERAIDSLSLFGTILNLKRVMLTSLPEPANVGMMTGSALDGMGAFVESTASMLGMGGSSEAKHKAFAELAGAIGSAENHMMQLSRYGLDQGSTKSRLRSKKFFIMNGLTRLDVKQRIRAVKYGRIFMQDLAEGVLEGGKKAEMAKYGLSDYGIAPGEAEKFSKWLIGNNSGMPDISALGNHDDPMTQTYLAALARFAKQTIQSTNAVNKPYMSYHPKARAIFGLTSFYYGLEHNVVQPVARRLVAALKGRNPATGAQMTAAQRLGVISSTLMPLMVIYGLNKAIFDAREKVSNPTQQKERSKFTQFMISMSRPGWTGRLNPLMGLIDDSYYDTELPYMLAGPNLARPAGDADAIRKYFSNQNSPNTPTGERAALKGMYDLMLGAMIYKFLPYAPIKGVGALGSFAAMQYLSAPEVQNDIATAGAEAMTGQKYKDPHHPGRQIRTGGREGGVQHNERSR